MKILHAAETIKGGIATVISHLTLGALKDGVETRCLIPSSHAGELATLPRDATVTFPSTSRGVFASLSFLFYFVRLVWVYRPDVVHLHSSFAGALGRATLFVMRPFLRCGVVYSPHAFAFTTQIPPIRKRLYAILERVLALATDAVICNCQYEMACALEHGLPPSKLVLIHNGVPDPGPPDIDPALSSSDLRLLFVGRFDFQKGFDVLLDAMSIIEGRPIQLTAIGASVRGGVVTEQRPNVHYEGWVKQSEISAYYRKAHLLVMPSRWEGFAMVALEALSNGLPVLSSDHPSFNETVLPGVTGYRFSSGDGAMLASLLCDLSPSALLSMRHRCYLHYQTNFRADYMVEQTVALYRGL